MAAKEKKRVLVTGSSGHLGEALVRTLRSREGHAYDVDSIDVLPSPYTAHVGSITHRAFVRERMRGVEVVFHCATLHKPHVATHTNEAFVEVNIKGTLNLLEEAAAAGVRAFIYTSTTSTFGDALVPPMSEPSAWITEDVTPIPRNIYGVTKVAAEDLCQLFHRNSRLNCLILRTSRFFLEEDDDREMAAMYDGDNIKANELLSRRVDVDDVVAAHLLASQRAEALGFGKYIISATSPFTKEDLAALRTDAPAVLRRHYPEYAAEFEKRGWRMFPSLDRIYVNEKARRELGWEPRYDFAYALECLKEGQSFRSPLSEAVGKKGYHRSADV